MTGLEARNVSVRLGTRLVLDDVSISLRDRTLTAIVGPNGSGKSTLLRVLAGLLPPLKGLVTLDGQPMPDLGRRAVARRVALLPQDTRCDFAFTVEEMVAMGRHPYRRRFERAADADRAAVESAIQVCDLRDLRTRTVDRLSGGERQRVAIARCLAAEPGLLLLDEPTAHLDLDHSLTLTALCRRLADEGRAVAVATHDLSAFARVATDVAVLHRGQLVAGGTPDEVLASPVIGEVFRVDAETVLTASAEKVFVFVRRERSSADRLEP